MSMARIATTAIVLVSALFAQDSGKPKSAICPILAHLKTASL